jgi:hypothetical protein
MARRGSKTEENTVTDTQTTEPNFDAPEDFDVDAPQAPVETEDTVATTETTTETKPAAKQSTRPPVPEGKVSPVAFAKILSEHLRKDHDVLGVRKGENESVAPQVVYSYIKNNGPDSRHPFPFEKAEGRAAVVDAEAALAWWDAKDLRVKEQKDGAAEKAAKKAEKANAKPGETPAETVEAPELVEAE